MPETIVTPAPTPSFGRRLLLGVLSLFLAAAIWLPLMHLGFRPPLPLPKNEGEVENRTEFTSGIMEAHFDVRLEAGFQLCNEWRDVTAF